MMKKRLVVPITLLILLSGSFLLNGQKVKGVEKVVIPFSSKDIKVELDRQWAFIIGINDYENITDLNNAAYDAAAIKKILISKYGYTEDKITCLYNNEAKIDSIQSQLDWYRDHLSRHDNLFIYFSGHGYVEDNDIGYWLPSDVGQDKREEVKKILKDRNLDGKGKDKKIVTISKWKILYYQVIRFLSKCKSKHIFLVMDSCYSAKIFQEFKFRTPLPSKNSLLQRSRQILASGRGIVSDGPPGSYSPFAAFILNFLDNNTRPFFSASTLIAKAKENSSISAEGGYIINTDNKGGEFYFF